MPPKLDNEMPRDSKPLHESDDFLDPVDYVSQLIRQLRGPGSDTETKWGQYRDEVTAVTRVPNSSPDELHGNSTDDQIESALSKDGNDSEPAFWGTLLGSDNRDELPDSQPQGSTSLRPDRNDIESATSGELDENEPVAAAGATNAIVTGRLAGDYLIGDEESADLPLFARAEGNDFASENGYAFRRSVLHNLREATQLATTTTIDLDECLTYAHRSYITAFCGAICTVFSIILLWMSPQPGTFGFSISVMTLAVGIGFGFAFITYYYLLQRKSSRLQRLRKGAATQSASMESLHSPSVMA